MTVHTIHILSMTNNVVPPFVLREAGIVVNDKAKLHTVNPTNDDHVIIFKETSFQIPLTLWGVFSYFATVKPTEETLHEGNDVYILAPETWHPHSNAYAHNKESMVDWEGNICAPKTGKHNLSLTIYLTTHKFNPQVYWQQRQKQLTTSVRQHILKRMRNIQQYYHSTQQMCSH